VTARRVRAGSCPSKYMYHKTYSEVNRLACGTNLEVYDAEVSADMCGLPDACSFSNPRVNSVVHTGRPQYALKDTMELPDRWGSCSRQDTLSGPGRTLIGCNELAESATRARNTQSVVPCYALPPLFLAIR
jgi:hypothetical protein